MNEVLTRKEAAYYLRISAVKLDRECRAGKLVYCKIGSRVVFRMKNLNDYLDTCVCPDTDETGGDK